MINSSSFNHQNNHPVIYENSARSSEKHTSDYHTSFLIHPLLLLLLLYNPSNEKQAIVLLQWVNTPLVLVICWRLTVNTSFLFSFLLASTSFHHFCTIFNRGGLPLLLQLLQLQQLLLEYN